MPGGCCRKEGATAIKMEGGEPAVPTVTRLVSIGIPVMGHLGLMPQSVHQQGGFRRQAKREDEQKKLTTTRSR